MGRGCGEFKVKIGNYFLIDNGNNEFRSKKIPNPDGISVDEDKNQGDQIVDKDGNYVPEVHRDITKFKSQYGISSFQGVHVKELAHYLMVAETFPKSLDHGFDFNNPKAALEKVGEFISLAKDANISTYERSQFAKLFFSGKTRILFLTHKANIMAEQGYVPLAELEKILAEQGYAPLPELEKILGEAEKIEGMNEKVATIHAKIRKKGYEKDLARIQESQKDFIEGFNSLVHNNNAMTDFGTGQRIIPFLSLRREAEQLIVSPAQILSGLFSIRLDTDLPIVDRQWYNEFTVRVITFQTTLGQKIQKMADGEDAKELNKAMQPKLRKVINSYLAEIEDGDSRPDDIVGDDIITFTIDYSELKISDFILILANTKKFLSEEYVLPKEERAKVATVINELKKTQ